MLGLGLNLSTLAIRSVSRGARIAVSGSALAENSTQGAAIGTASVSGLSGPFTWTLSSVSPAGTLQISGANPANTIALQAGATAVDREANAAISYTLTADNGTKTVTLSGQIAVTDVNEATPVITSNGGGATAAISINENTTAVTTVTATDADATATLTYSISGGADAALFQINATTGVLSFITAPNYEVPTDANTDNAYVVIVQVSDGSNTDTQTIAVTVTNVVEVPVITAASISGTASVGSTLSLSITATDMGSGTYAYAWRADGTAISGATSATYTLTSGEVGKVITCAITPTNSAGTGSAFVTAATSAVVAPSATFPTLTGLYSRHSAENPANTGSRYVETFAPSAVNTTTGAITLSSPGFLAWTTFPAATGNPVEFVTTGTLPSELSDSSKQYFLSPVGDGTFYVYAAPTSGDVANIPGELSSDDPLYPAQNFAYRVNKIVPSSQGTGTHTVRSKAEALLSQLAQLVSGKDYVTNANAPSDKNSHFEMFSDASGDKYLRSQRLARDTALGGLEYIAFGKTYPQGPSGSRYAARSEVAGKRQIVTTFVMYPDLTDDKLIARSNVLSTGVNTTTDVCTQSSGAGAATMSLITAEATKVRALPGGSLPSPLDAGTTYYARISALTFTLHPTATDATNNTNKIDLTTQGSGTWQAYQETIPGPIERMRFPIEHLDPASGQNVLTPRYNASPSAGGDYINQLATDVTTSGVNNGRFGNTGRNSRSAGETAQIRIWYPPGATPPTRLDTGLPLAAGTYWQSLEPSSSTYVRLHDTQAAAIAAIGVATSSLTGASACIEYSAAGVGRAKVEAVSRPWNVGVAGNDPFTPAAYWSPPNQTKGVLTIVVDYNDPTATYVRVKMYWNGVKVSDYEVTGLAKGLTGAALNDGTSAWTLLNSAQAHVTWEGWLYEIVWQATTDTIPETEIIGTGSLHEYMMSHYHIS